MRTARTKQTDKAMKINEIYTTANGFFNWLKTNEPDTYAEWLGNTESIYFDSYALATIGMLSVSPYLEQNKDDIASVWTLMFALFDDSWSKIYAALSADYEVAAPYDYEETKTGTDKVTDETNSVRLGATKAFNESEFTDRERDNDTLNGTHGTEYNTTVIRKGNNGTDVTRRIDKEITMRAKYKFSDLVIKDIASKIGLCIYE